MKTGYRILSMSEWMSAGIMLIVFGNQIAKPDQYPDLMHHVSNFAQFVSHAICAGCLWYASDKLK